MSLSGTLTKSVICRGVFDIGNKRAELFAPKESNPQRLTQLTIILTHE